MAESKRTEQARQLARSRIWTSTDAKTGEVTIGICDGAGVAWTIAVKAGPDQATLVEDNIGSLTHELASFVQLGMDAVETESDEARGERLRALRVAADQCRAELDDLHGVVRALLIDIDSGAALASDRPPLRRLRELTECR